MADQNNDILMQIVPNSGKALASESGSILLSGSQQDVLLTDFTPGFFCELQEFNFAAGIESLIFKTKEDEYKKEGEEAVSEDGKPLRTKSGTNSARKEANRKAFIAKPLRAPREERNAQRTRDEFVDMQPVSYTRIIDSASTELFKLLIGSKELSSISIVKRRASGMNVSGLGYLRLDFQNVLLTALEWKDAEHLMVEHGSFIYRKLDMTYYPQLSDGSPGKISKMETWTMQVQRTARTG